MEKSREKSNGPPSRAALWRDGVVGFLIISPASCQRGGTEKLKPEILKPETREVGR